ncbi:hypothetical protein DPM13_15740 [Paracoccus mutanolyticus]|uniref:Uncharacterized protein n=1 Tax=Paracoccus mutanolyticus TaxID=1499308 RepID=A0ABN5MBA1_9RHOB|nr:hypothetical protein [Paracoccus mutanolyticus]AWX93937.1 hypothetical protein DPM13_15740 [Paracoccus mutanolyticus]
MPSIAVTEEAPCPAIPPSSQIGFNVWPRTTTHEKPALDRVEGKTAQFSDGTSKPLAAINLCTA